MDEPRYTERVGNHGHECVIENAFGSLDISIWHSSFMGDSEDGVRIDHRTTGASVDLGECLLHSIAFSRDGTRLFHQAIEGGALRLPWLGRARRLRVIDTATGADLTGIDQPATRADAVFLEDLFGSRLPNVSGNPRDVWVADVREPAFLLVGEQPPAPSEQERMEIATQTLNELAASGPSPGRAETERWFDFMALLREWPEPDRSRAVEALVPALARVAWTVRRNPAWLLWSVPHPAWRLIGHVTLTPLASEGGPLGDVGVARLVECTHIPAVHELVLRQSALSDASVRRLTSWPALRDVRHLDLAKNGLTDRSAQALAACPGVSGLVTLLLHYNRLTAKGVAALLERGRFRAMRDLYVHHNDVERSEVAELIRERGVNVHL